MSYLVEDATRIRAAVAADTDVPADSDELFLLYAVLLNVKGEHVTAGDVHDAWTAWMELRGETHESMRPFAELRDDVRAEDEPFAAAIRLAAGDRGRRGNAPQDP